MEFTPIPDYKIKSCLNLTYYREVYGKNWKVLKRTEDQGFSNNTEKFQSVVLLKVSNRNMTESESQKVGEPLVKSTSGVVTIICFCVMQHLISMSFCWMVASYPVS